MAKGMADVGHCEHGDFRLVGECPLYKGERHGGHEEPWVISEFRLRLVVIRRLIMMIGLVFVGHLLFYEMRKSSEFWSVELTTKERLDIIRAVRLNKSERR